MKFTNDKKREDEFSSTKRVERERGRKTEIFEEIWNFRVFVGEKKKT